VNERLKELLLQAALEALKEEPTDYIACDMLKVEKFASLIIKECCFTGEQYAEGLIDMNHYAFVNTKIKEHFGVG
jgi:hypothetical protein